ncbi:MAG: hypothetical protein ACYC1D_00185 [Acidimicrobiales bacterium]
MSEGYGAGDEGVGAWLAAELPPDWGVEGVEIVSDADEVLVVVTLTDPDPSADEVVRWREATRRSRMALAERGEARFVKKVSWGVRRGDTTVVFTSVAVPVMTRLRLPERRVLDVLIDAGVARSRSEALAWCVRLVGDNEATWIAELMQAFAQVAEVRRRGPRSRRAPPA